MESRIIRAEHNEKNPYTCISNRILQGSLSGMATAILCYLLSHGDGWQVWNPAIMHRFGIGRKALEKALSELKERGYIQRPRVRLENGQWDYVSVVREIPIEKHERDDSELRVSDVSDVSETAKQNYKTSVPLRYNGGRYNGGRYNPEGNNIISNESISNELISKDVTSNDLRSIFENQKSYAGFDNLSLENEPPFNEGNIVEIDSYHQPESQDKKGITMLGTPVDSIPKDEQIHLNSNTCSVEPIKEGAISSVTTRKLERIRIEDWQPTPATQYLIGDMLKDCEIPSELESQVRAVFMKKYAGKTSLEWDSNYYDYCAGKVRQVDKLDKVSIPTLKHYRA
jgi:hypothetical protein